MINREYYLNKLRRLSSLDAIKVVTGVRRCGKSTILKQYLNELVQNGVLNNQIQYYNFEDPKLSELLLNWKSLYYHIISKKVPNKKNYIFIDEVQNLNNFQKLVDGLFVNENIDLYITGSNAYILSGELATLLSGRYVEIKMLPFSFAEFIEMNDKNKRVDQLFNEYLLYGSLPEVVNIYQNSPENANDYIDAVIESVVEKDVEFRHKFRDNELLTKVIKFLFDSVGSPISAGNIAKSLAVSGRPVSNHTIDNILEALTRSFIFYKSQRYDIRGKELLKTLSKYYAVDLGMRNRMLGRDSGTDLGHLLENVVYFELLRRESKISTGKIGEKEVDFSIIDNNGRISYIQVAWSTYDEKTLEHELAPLKAIKDSNAKILITTDINIGQTYDGIRKINVIDWLLDDQMNLF